MMADYDIDKVSPRPWKVKVNEKVLADGHTFREFWIEDANGGIVTIYPKHSNPRQEEFYAHIVHCVNEADTLRDLAGRLAGALGETVPCAIALQAIQDREDYEKNRGWCALLAEAREAGLMEESDETRCI